MLKIKFIQNNGEERIVETYAGPTLMEAASAAGVEGIEAICGGSCICGTCQVYIEGDFAAVGPPGEDELHRLGGKQGCKGTHHVCHARLKCPNHLTA